MQIGLKPLSPKLDICIPRVKHILKNKSDFLKPILTNSTKLNCAQLNRTERFRVGKFKIPQKNQIILNNQKEFLKLC